MATASLTKLVARTLWIIGARSSSFDDTVSDDRFIQEEIRRALLETEAEVVRALCEANHPLRTQFLGWSSALANGDTLPKHIGSVESVRITPYPGAGTTVIGESTSRSNINDWRTNTNNIFDAINHNANGSSLAGYFNITNETIVFTGNAAEVKVCTYSPDYSTPALQIDDHFDGTLIAGTIPKLNKLGVPQSLVMAYGQQYINFLSLLRNGAIEMPTLSEAQQSE